MYRLSHCFRWVSRLLVRSVLLVAAAGISSCVSAADEPKAAQPAAAAPAAKREFTFQVNATDGRPVAGARVKPWGVTYDNGSFWIDEKLFPDLRSGPDGSVRIVFPSDEQLSAHVADEQTRLLRDALRHGLNRIALQVDHPDHPRWSEYVADGTVIVLVKSTTILIRARRPNGERVTRLYPRLGSMYWDASDRSEEDGVLTVRRVDLASSQPTRWLRVVHAPEQGPVLFSDLIDLKQHAERPIALGLLLKPGIRFVGRLSGDVPRPIKNGRIVARIVAGQEARTDWEWSARGEADADGKFVLDSLPPDHHVQLIALCDGWVSKTPTEEEIDAYASQNGFKLPRISATDFFVRGRLYRINDQPVVRLVPMERTADCIVTVLDPLGKPLAGAKVDFWPNQLWYSGGSQILGFGMDTLSNIRDEIAGRPRPLPVSSNIGFSEKTDAQGEAKIFGLPTPGGATAVFQFSVSHGDYAETGDGSDGDTPTVKIMPGETGKVTVRLKPK